MGKDKRKKKEKKDDLTLVVELLNDLIKMLKAGKNKTETILAIIKRIGEDESIQQRLKANEEAEKDLQKAKDLITSVKHKITPK